MQIVLSNGFYKFYSHSPSLCGNANTYLAKSSITAKLIRIKLHINFVILCNISLKPIRAIPTRNNILTLDFN